MFALFSRGRSWPTFGAFIAAGVLAAMWARLDLVQVPLQQDRASLRLAWASCLPAVVAATAMASPNPELEATYPRGRISRYRAGWLVLLALSPPTIACLFSLVVGSSWWEVWWFARNHVLVLGIGALSVLVLAPSAAWIVPASYVLLTWFVGTLDATGTPAFWALPRYLPDVWWVNAASVSLIVGAIVAHAAWPPKADV